MGDQYKIPEHRVADVIKYPVKYIPLTQSIHDATSHHVLDIRGWGRIQKLLAAEEMMDAIGEFVADAINEKLLKYGKDKNGNTSDSAGEQIDYFRSSKER